MGPGGFGGGPRPGAGADGGERSDRKAAEAFVDHNGGVLRSLSEVLAEASSND